MHVDGGRCVLGGRVFLCLGIIVSCVERSVLRLGACGRARCCGCGVLCFEG